LDILLTGNAYSERISKIYRNDNGSFSDLSANLAGIEESSAAWGDYDNDGDLDILLTGTTNGYGSGCVAKVYRNDNGDFIEVDEPLMKFKSGKEILRNNNVNKEISNQNVKQNTGMYFKSDYAIDENTTLTTDINKIPTIQDKKFGVIKEDNQHGQRLNSEMASSITGVYYSSVAWGDHDNDGDLDFLLTGYTGSEYIAEIYRNNISTSNTIPTTPTNLFSTTSPNSVTLSWDKSTDSQTSQDGLTYNIRLGSTSGGIEKVTPMANMSNGYRMISKIGNTNHNNSWNIGNLVGGTYYWSIQSIDNVFAGSVFSGESSFVVENALPTLTEVTPDSGYRQETLDVSFIGDNFLSGVTSVDFGANITVNSTTVNSATQLTANITIDNSAALGLRNVSVINAAPGYGTTRNTCQ